VETASAMPYPRRSPVGEGTTPVNGPIELVEGPSPKLARDDVRGCLHGGGVREDRNGQSDWTLEAA